MSESDGNLEQVSEMSKQITDVVRRLKTVESTVTSMDGRIPKKPGDRASFIFGNVNEQENKICADSPADFARNPPFQAGRDREYCRLPLRSDEAHR